MTIREIHDEACKAILEPGGPTLGLISSETIIGLYVSVAQDFLSKTGLIEKMAIVRANFGQTGHTLPDWMATAKVMYYDGEHLDKTTLSAIEQADLRWADQRRTPESWRSDRLPPKEFEVQPAPAKDGGQVGVSDINGLYGTVAGSSVGPEVEFQSFGPFLGTIAGDDYGEGFVEVAGPMLGTIADLQVADGNILVIGSATIFSSDPTLADIVELVPDSFAIYLGYGVMRDIFQTDGELKDELRARYCSARYDEGVALGQAIMKDAIRQEVEEGR